MARFIGHMLEKFPNATRFRSGNSRRYNVAINGNSHSALQLKQEGYYTRLYYGFEETKRLGGFTCFITLTHNDRVLAERKANPDTYGQVCFDYKQLREEFLHGSFYETIQNLGYEMKYFVGCELGEGKGTRGLDANGRGLNPHYHVELFIRPNVEHPKPLTPQDVLHYAKIAWQGFDENTDGYHDYRGTKIGIASESEQGVLVQDYKACAYVSKYVTKDVATREMENEVKNAILVQVLEDYPDLADLYYSEEPTPEKEMAVADIMDICNHLFRKWCNRYSAKVRISNKLGLSEILTEDGKMTNKVGVHRVSHIPYVEVPVDGELKKKALPLYYYRKIYLGYEYYTYTDERTGEVKRNVHYFLNERGQKQKDDELPCKIDRKAKKARKAFNAYLAMTDEQKEKLTGVVYTCDDINFEDENLPEFWAIYSIVYKDRYYGYRNCNPFGDGPTIDYRTDYHNFNIPCKKRSDDGAVPPKEINERFFNSRTPFCKHEMFAPFADVFDNIDCLVDAMDCQKDNKNKADYEERCRTRKAIINLKYRNR